MTKVGVTNLLKSSRIDYDILRLINESIWYSTHLLPTFSENTGFMSSDRSTRTCKRQRFHSRYEKLMLLVVFLLRLWLSVRVYYVVASKLFLSLRFLGLIATCFLLGYLICWLSLPITHSIISSSSLSWKGFCGCWRKKDWVSTTVNVNAKQKRRNW
jgi:hypothetical protein